MVETVIQGPTQVRRNPDGSRDVLCLGEPNHAYAIRVPAEAVREMREGLAMDEQQMQDAHARQEAASRLVVPNGVMNGRR